MLIEHLGMAVARNAAEQVPAARRSRGARAQAQARKIYDVERAGADAVSRVNVAVAVADDACSCIYEIAAACRALGFDHTATLTTVGVLTGSVEFEKLAGLWAVPGVLAVEVECDFPLRITARVQYGRRVN
jgi:hypothetical protein